MNRNRRVSSSVRAAFSFSVRLDFPNCSSQVLNSLGMFKPSTSWWHRMDLLLHGGPPTSPIKSPLIGALSNAGYMQGLRHKFWRSPATHLTPAMALRRRALLSCSPQSIAILGTSEGMEDKALSVPNRVSQELGVLWLMVICKVLHRNLIHLRSLNLLNHRSTSEPPAYTT